MPPLSSYHEDSIQCTECAEGLLYEQSKKVFERSMLIFSCVGRRNQCGLSGDWGCHNNNIDDLQRRHGNCHDDQQYRWGSHKVQPVVSGKKVMREREREYQLRTTSGKW